MSDESKDELYTTKQNYLLEHSYLGILGRFISPIFAPLGFEWRESVSLLTGLAVKEVVVATMSVLYSAGTELDESAFKQAKRGYERANCACFYTLCDVLKSLPSCYDGI